MKNKKLHYFYYVVKVYENETKEGIIYDGITESIDKYFPLKNIEEAWYEDKNIEKVLFRLICEINHCDYIYKKQQFEKINQQTLN